MAKKTWRKVSKKEFGEESVSVFCGFSPLYKAPRCRYRRRGDSATLYVLSSFRGKGKSTSSPWGRVYGVSEFAVKEYAQAVTAACAADGDDGDAMDRTLRACNRAYKRLITEASRCEIAE